MGIDTPKKDNVSKTWSEDDLKGALHALRAGSISANKASKAYGKYTTVISSLIHVIGVGILSLAPTFLVKLEDLQLTCYNYFASHLTVVFVK